MTIRQLASNLLRFAIRHAPSEAQSWGQAMLREMDFVAGDWAALLWAIESAATLILRRNSNSRPLTQAEILPRTKELLATIRLRTLGGYAACAAVIAWLARDFLLFSSTAQRAGWAITMCACIYMAYQLFQRRGRALPSDPASSAFADFYRAELIRQRDFHRGWWLWSRVVFLFVGCELLSVGSAFADPMHARNHAAAVACFAFLCILAVPNNLKRARKYKRQIDELDASRKTLP